MNFSDMFSRDTKRQRTEQMLDRLGLQRKNKGSTTFASLGLFGLGMAVGMGMGLLFAPSSGREIRSQAMNKLPQVGDRMAGQEQIHQAR